jgi:hypothetical protein
MDVGKKAAELQDRGFCVLRKQFPAAAIGACRGAFLPRLTDYLGENAAMANRGPGRFFLPMPFEPPCFQPAFFFDDGILSLMREGLGERIVADQWGCDVPIPGSRHQAPHVDYQRPLFEESPDLLLPPYMMVVSFGLVAIGRRNGPIEIAPGTHRMPREAALQAVETGAIAMQAVELDVGDVLVRHPWALHRGTPNLTDTPRPLVTIRYVRRWFADNSREVAVIPASVWRTLSPAQQALLRFPVEAG